MDTIEQKADASEEILAVARAAGETHPGLMRGAMRPEMVPYGQLARHLTKLERDTLIGALFGARLSTPLSSPGIRESTDWTPIRSATDLTDFLDMHNE